MRCAAVLGFVLLAACERPSGEARSIDRSLIAVGDKVTLRTDTVGVERFRSQATFALVDAENLGDTDADVTLGGVLVDADGHAVGTLRPESLRVPARRKRTFALVDREQAARPAAVSARIDVRGAQVPRFGEPVRMIEGHAYRDGDRVVVTGKVKNPHDRPCIAIVLASFHDAAGVPLTRPFAVFTLGGHAERPSRFVGPSGSAAGTIFVGDVMFCPREGCEVDERVQDKLW